MQADKMRNTFELTNTMQFDGKKLSPGTSLVIADRRENHGYYFLTLKEESSGSQDIFSLRWLLQHKSEFYAVLLYSPLIRDDQDITYRIVLKVVSANHLVAISDEELETVYDDCVRAIDGNRQAVEQVPALFGDFHKVSKSKSAGQDDEDRVAAGNPAPIANSESGAPSELSAAANQQDLSLLGLNVGDYTIDSILGEGLFARVYRGTKETGSSKAFKVASPFDNQKSAAADCARDTQALMQITGGLMRARPDTSALLSIECERLKSNAHPSLVSIDAFCTIALPYYQMEYIEGTTLRQLMQEGTVPLKIFLHIARAMNQLLRDTTFTYHGDLKPENIIITKEDTIKFIDPGYFGELKDDSGQMFQALVTTPMYYPYMKPDDVFALGLILWEAAFGKNPLAVQTSSDQITLDGISEELLMHIRGLEMVGNFNLSGLLTVEDPEISRPDMAAEKRAFLLKAIRLHAGKTMGLDSGYQSMGQIAGALIALIERGIEHF